MGNYLSEIIEERDERGLKQQPAERERKNAIIFQRRMPGSDEKKRMFQKKKIQIISFFREANNCTELESPLHPVQFRRNTHESERSSNKFISLKLLPESSKKACQI